MIDSLDFQTSFTLRLAFADTRSLFPNTIQTAMADDFVMTVDSDAEDDKFRDDDEDAFKLNPDIEFDLAQDFAFGSEPTPQDLVVTSSKPVKLLRLAS